MSGPEELPRLGRYQVINKLAQGGMAEIFLAKATGAMGFERLVAIKLIHSHLTRDSEFVKMFIDEARIAMHLHHRNIVQVFDLDKSGDTWYIAMEYVHGVNLYDVYERIAAKNRWVDLPLSLYIISEACKGLHFAHTRPGPDGRPLGIVHRDISPQNIMLSFEGEVKITDFGIAKATERLHQTTPGIVKGKYAYMAPECLQEQPTDARVDVFAAGVVLYELLVGENPFAGDSAVDTIERVLNNEVPAPSQRGAMVAPELDAITLKALAKDPNKRYQTALELSEALTEYGLGLTMARRDIAAGDATVAATLAELFPEKLKRPPTSVGGPVNLPVAQKPQPSELATPVHTREDESYAVEKTVMLKSGAQQAIKSASTDPAERTDLDLEKQPRPGASKAGRPASTQAPRTASPSRTSGPSPSSTAARNKMPAAQYEAPTAQALPALLDSDEDQMPVVSDFRDKTDAMPPVSVTGELRAFSRDLAHMHSEWDATALESASGPGSAAASTEAVQVVSVPKQGPRNASPQAHQPPDAVTPVTHHPGYGPGLGGHAQQPQLQQPGANVAMRQQVPAGNLGQRPQLPGPAFVPQPVYPQAQQPTMPPGTGTRESNSAKVIAAVLVVLAVIIVGVTIALKMRPQGPAAVMIKISSTPPGAEVTVDGVLQVPKTPLEVPMSEGAKHVVVVSAPGHKPETKEVLPIAGVTSALQFTLAPLGPGATQR